jgi:hypothetical protein
MKKFRKKIKKMVKKKIKKEMNIKYNVINYKDKSLFHAIKRILTTIDVWIAIFVGFFCSMLLELYSFLNIFYIETQNLSPGFISLILRFVCCFNFIF